METLDRVIAAEFDAIESQVASVDADGVIVYTNETWDACGRENGLVGEPIGPGDDYFAVYRSDDEDDTATACEGLEAVLDGDTDRFSFEYPCHTPNERRWFIMRATPLDVDGRRHAVVMHVDITDRKLAEIEAREHTEQFELVARVLSHDLRNPINVAMGGLEADDPDIVEQQLERMADITENALVFPRGTDDSKPETLDLGAVARWAWESVETPDATIEFEGTLELRADPRLIPHLFENLFRNSIEHVDPGVHVTVGALEDGFYVTDDGPGLPESTRSAAASASRGRDSASRSYISSRTPTVGGSRRPKTPVAPDSSFIPDRESYRRLGAPRVANHRYPGQQPAALFYYLLIDRKT